MSKGRPGLYKWIGTSGNYYRDGKTYEYDGTYMRTESSGKRPNPASSSFWEYIGPLEEQQEKLVVYICDACSFAPCYLATEEHTGGGPPNVCAYNLEGYTVNWRVNGTT